MREVEDMDLYHIGYQILNADDYPNHIPTPPDNSSSNISSMEHMEHNGDQHTYHPSTKNRTSIPDHQTTRLKSTPYKVNPSNHQLRHRTNTYGVQNNEVQFPSPTQLITALIATDRFLLKLG
jgi:hypothetical protein